MRRIVIGLVIALVGAGFAGRLVSTSAIDVNGATLSTPTLRAELAVITSHPNYACYLGYALGSPIVQNGSRMAASTVAQWTSLQVRGIAVIQYDETHYHWRMTPSQLTDAESAYASNLNYIVASDQEACDATATQALSQLPAWFLDTELTQNAASQEFTQEQSGAIALTTAGLRALYDKDPASYDTVCLAVVEVPTGAKESVFEAAAKRGVAVATLAKDYSILSTADKGGNDGCYGPSSSEFKNVVTLTQGLALDRFPTTAQDTSDGDAYFVTATKRTPNTFAKAESYVLSQAETENAQLASLRQAALLHTPAVLINPEFGRWRAGVSSVITLARPPAAATPNAGAGLAP